MPIYSASGSLSGIQKTIEYTLKLIDEDKTITEYRLKNNFPVDKNHEMFFVKARELDNIWDVRIVRKVYLKKEFKKKFDDDTIKIIESLAQNYVNKGFDKYFE